MGIVNAFVGMAASGSGGLSAISAGVAEALITTAFGLIVAIPAVWVYNYFQMKIDNLTAEMTYTSKEMIDYLIKGVSGEFGRSRFTREFNTSRRRQSRSRSNRLTPTGGMPNGNVMGSGRRQGGAERDADDRRHAGAADHLHARRPGDPAGFKAIAAAGHNLKPHPEEDRDQVLGIDAKGQYYLNKKPIKNVLNKYTNQ